MKREICIHKIGSQGQVMFDAETNEAMDDVEWLDLIGARITRIREERFPESQLVISLFKMPK